MIEVVNLVKTFIKTENVEVEGRGRNSIKKSKHLLKNKEFNAVDKASFSVKKGEIVGVLGPNGAGKTTLLRMIGGILTPTSGEVIINGKSILDNVEKVKSMIGYLSGNTKLYGRLTPRELLKTFGRLYMMEDKDIDFSIEKIIDLIKLDTFIDNRIESLSTGQMQRVSIARCLIHSPEIYIFDEPTLGLDVISSRDIISFMKNEKNNGKTVLYSTHYMEEAETLCDRLIFIYAGRVLAEGSSQEIKKLAGRDNLRDAFIELANLGGLDEI